MNIRAQVSMVFHLDKCIGCHTCSIACKNIWTDRKGAEYMWWNNVETKPGTGYPVQWEDQAKYRGGWEKKPGSDRLSLRMNGRLGTLGNIFYNPHLPRLEDYYEPWTYQYEHLTSAPEGDDQPTARPISMITGEPIEIQRGPNWDDDLSGSAVYAANDPNLDGMSDDERQMMFEVERLVFFYLPRICNHCLNAGCVAACPTGAIYKRGEDGIVLVNQDRCRGWRMCVTGCPYKKVYYNWSTGKSEKCILCYPRLETGQAPACFHTCVGRIRYLGVLLYDADRIQQAAAAEDHDLVEAQRAIIVDPFDPAVIAAARANGVPDAMIEAAQNSPVYQFVKAWKLALPLHPEFRTVPMLFYVPPMLPIQAVANNGRVEVTRGNNSENDYFGTLDQARLPMRYMARLFSAGNEDEVAQVYRRLIAVRLYRRAQNASGELDESARQALAAAGLTAAEAQAIYEMTSMPTFEQRFVIPPLAREVNIEALQDPFTHKAEAGFGFEREAKRGE
ncbi:MAG: nitrate reductase subunit beta [Anaerolineae bacterium]|nr:nitrate reductase subunit beta [Anaerolineae bacterium]